MSRIDEDVWHYADDDKAPRSFLFPDLDPANPEYDPEFAAWWKAANDRRASEARETNERAERVAQRQDLSFVQAIADLEFKRWPDGTAAESIVEVMQAARCTKAAIVRCLLLNSFRTIEIISAADVTASTVSIQRRILRDRAARDQDFAAMVPPEVINAASVAQQRRTRRERGERVDD
jgi:hypothetical protein